MSRRPAAGADRTEQNRTTLKALVKLEANKSCADCKRNKHPRWASWNLGIFVCIRCSGIHRGLGTHISRVKSVDLDSWTDEQLASMVRWGNARANRYWEHKLAEGHVPNESKIENFIRTKYDSRRWVMDGPMPDPSTLDAGTEDEDVPLSVVKEKARERAASMRNGTQHGVASSQPSKAFQPQGDLFGDTEPAPPARPNTTGPVANRQPPSSKAAAASPKQTRPGESLLGLDFLGSTPSAPPARASSASPGPVAAGKSGRSDLKQSILSLYASKPAPPPFQSGPNTFGGMQSPRLTSPSQQQTNTTALSGLNDAFSTLSFGASTPTPKPAQFGNLTSSAGNGRQPSAGSSSMGVGGFFDIKPAAPAKQASPPAPPRARGDTGEFGSFSSGLPSLNANPAPLPPSMPHSSSIMDDLFDLTASVPAPTQKSMPELPVQPQSRSQQSPGYSSNSAFNLSSVAGASNPPAKPATAPTMAISGLGNMDAWGSNDEWNTPESRAASKAAPIQSTMTNAIPKPLAAAGTQPASALDTGGWGDPTPARFSASANTTSAAELGNKTTSGGGFTVQQDEEFGGWSHASPVASTPGPKHGGLGGNQDDLFGNVWE